jgi:hypothetical protein
MIDPHEYAERCVKGRSHETQKQRIASTENLIIVVQSDTLRWAARECAERSSAWGGSEILETMRDLFRDKADAIERGT